MQREQSRIEGDYSIVSVWRKGAFTNRANTRIAVERCWNAGLSVAIAVGVWPGEREESLIISGPGHRSMARALGQKYRQEAYITVGSGIATLMIFNGYNYVVGSTFTRQVEASDADTSYTIGVGLLAYKFVA